MANNAVGADKDPIRPALDDFDILDRVVRSREMDADIAEAGHDPISNRDIASNRRVDSKTPKLGSAGRTFTRARDGESLEIDRDVGVDQNCCDDLGVSHRQVLGQVVGTGHGNDEWYVVLLDLALPFGG